MKKHYLRLSLALIFIMQSCINKDTNVVTSLEAEKHIDKKFIHAMVKLESFPKSGKIEVNSPWMLWSPVVKEKKGYNTYEFKEGFLYRGRVSKDPEFKDATTMTSEAREWSFFNPHQELNLGTWYWQHAVIDKKTNIETWSEVMTFEVTGEERKFVSPPIGQVIKNIPRNHPRVLATKDQIGKLPFPKKAVTIFINKMDGFLGKTFPKSLIYHDEAVLSEKRTSINKVDYNRFIDKRTKEIYRGHKFRLESMLKAYLVTGDAKYVEESLRRYFYLKKQYFDIVKKGVSNDFTDGFYLNILAGIYDVCYDYLEDDEKEYIKKTLIVSQKKTYHHFLHRAEHYILDSHMWQFHLRTFLGTALSLVHDVPEAKKWVEYIYEVWTMKAPVGSRNDGGWFTGNGYFDANKGSLLIMPIIMTRMTGVNYFDHPWYQNVGAYLAYTAPVGHIAGSYGDNADVKKENTMDFVMAYAHITGDPYARQYIDLGKKLGTPETRGIRKASDEESRLPMGLDENGNLFWYMYQPLPLNAKRNHQTDFSRSKVFADVGTVTTHTDLLNPDRNLMFSFRSSPFGMVGHSQASQNTFNIQYGGEPLFFRTGYYSSWADHHSLQSYKHTRAHNGVLADGIGQAYTTEGYGWVARFATGEKISYALGDASNAYNGTMRDQLIKMFKKWDVHHTPENGFGNPGVTRFRRHTMMLEDHIIVIYDELEANKPVTWSWLIHSKDTLAGSENSYYTENKKGKGTLHLYNSNNDLKNTVTNKFHAPAVDWLGNGWKRGITYKNHWHGKTDTEKLPKTRFLAILQVTAKENEFMPMSYLGGGKLQIDGWQISVELDENKPASFICKKEGAGAISFNNRSIEMNAKKYVHQTPGSTMLIEIINDKIEKQEVIDTLPDEVIYY
ncbi:DUF4962 domain-containing protein [Flavivirga spongiicola]|uniref:DUF4962 domain-containing protein n=1 Tax=Flavivirga spongiicola TaxID=421621 RepID=A0ABU7XW81_9FLAO|nr:DUF4962 domain-containing protein [Flavivirga sp. MEBiC05379]MDO5980036.1 DUF4962 domain-containing protein [Flavivirga sp. MEBiC05379]